jgi:hypothetical protein
MSLSVIFEPEAEQEIIEAFQWYEEQSFGLGGEFLRAVVNAKQYSPAVPSNIKFNTESTPRVFAALSLRVALHH